MSGSRQAHAVGRPSLVSSCAPAAAAPGSASSASSSARAAPVAQLRVLVQQQAVAPARLAQQRRVVLGLAGAPLEREQPRVRVALAHRLGRAVVGGVVEHQQLVLHAGRVGALDRGEAGEQVVAPVRVHHAVGELGQRAASSSTAQRARRPARRGRTRARRARARCGPCARPSSRVVAQPGDLLGQVRRRRPARTYRPASFSSTSSRIQPSMFTIAGRPAANVSKSLFGRVRGEHRHVLEEREAGARLARPAAPRRAFGAGSGTPRSAGAVALELRAALAVAHQHEASRPAASRAASTTAVRSLASPMRAEVAARP